MYDDDRLTMVKWTKSKLFTFQIRTVKKFQVNKKILFVFDAGNLCGCRK